MVLGIALLAGCGPNQAYRELMRTESFSHASPSLVFPPPVVGQVAEDAGMGPTGFFAGPSQFNQRPIGVASDGRYQAGEVIYYRERYHDRQSSHSPNHFYRYFDFYREGVLYR